VLVGQRVVDGLNQRNRSQNLVAHLVHSVLDTSTHIGSECLERNVPRSLPRSIVIHSLRLIKRLEDLPLPARLNLRAENTIPGLRKLCELVAVKAVERRPGALKYQQLLDLRAERDALALSGHRLDNANLLAVTEERVRVRLAVNSHARPAVLNDLDVCGVDVGVGFNEVRTDYSGEGLGWADGVLLCEDVACLLLGVGCDHYGVVCARVAANC